MAIKFKFNIQFFGQERTEPATPRKREKVREEGRVCVSKDLTAATELIVGLMGMLMFGALTWRTLTFLITFSVNFMGDKTLNDEGWLYFVNIFGLPVKVALGFFVLAAVLPLAVDMLFPLMERWIEFALGAILLWR